MKDRKRQLENLAFYDKAAIEDRAAHMAEKGWLVEQPGRISGNTGGSNQRGWQ